MIHAAPRSSNAGLDGETTDRLPASLAEALAGGDVARVNLTCAAGLPGAEDLDLAQCLGIVDRWAQAVRRYTADCLSEFSRHPEAYQQHPGLFRLLCLVTLVKKGLGVTYEPTAIGSQDFRHARHDFLHGLLLDRRGTCTSLPVLFVALGRRLGYPVHLAVAKGHVLCQWVDSEHGRLNFEGACPGGGAALPDAHYQRWPRAMTKQDLASGRYLRPLSAVEELALFLETRGHCLADNGRLAEARQAYEQARHLAPAWSDAAAHLYDLTLREHSAAGPCGSTTFTTETWPLGPPVVGGSGLPLAMDPG